MIVDEVTRLGDHRFCDLDIIIIDELSKVIIKFIEKKNYSSSKNFQG